MSTDPMGRRALFSPPPDAATPPESKARESKGREVKGKRALYSTASTSPSLTTVMVECSGCGGRSRIGLVEFAWRHLPFWLWMPWARYSNLMTCPACERRTWVGVAFFA